MTTLTTTHAVLTPKGPEPWAEDLFTIPTFGTLKVQRHVIHHGRQNPGSSDYWNYAYGWIRAERCQLNTRAEPLISNSGTEYSIDALAIRHLRLFWDPLPGFTDEMIAELTVRLSVTGSVSGTISGNIENAAVSAGINSTIDLYHLTDSTKRVSQLTATTAHVDISRTTETTSAASGTAEIGSTVSGNAQLDPTSPPSGSATGQASVKVGGSTSDERKQNESFTARRVGASATINVETLSVCAQETDTLTRARPFSKTFQTRLAASCTSQSSGNDVSATASLQVASEWDFEVAINWKGKRIAMLEPDPQVETKLAILSLVNQGTPLAVAAAAMGIKNRVALAETLAIKIPIGYPVRFKLPGDMVGFG